MAFTMGNGWYYVLNNYISFNNFRNVKKLQKYPVSEQLHWKQLPNAESSQSDTIFPDETKYIK